MYLLLGKENCSRCEMVKNILNNKNIKYDYKLLNDLPNEEKRMYAKMTRESGLIEMPYPIIIKDNKIIDLKEII